MPHSNPKDQHDRTLRRPWLLGGVVFLCILVLITVIVAIVMNRHKFVGDFEYTQAQLLEETLGVNNDELIMLIISLVVVVQIAASIKFLRWIPNRFLVLSGFACVALSAFCTVVESLFSGQTAEALNYVEHIAFMIASVLMAVWCGLWTFARREPEGT
ncbi:MAG: hypothetical protein OEV87_09565 [Phycisphaerae bacterium]|nr:hypothetical protein [Phycisphaerae bacterium]